ncbi:pstA domain protein [Mycobacterium xenopi 4042]|uniref:PstA domain protein n=1 Tax=Mycobacterium xenopi 4042 TaxID=1299334 RepID=X7YMM8_MYCXE|nr:pstA domain protein [Mycobacterium xenopi 4042]
MALFRCRLRPPGRSLRWRAPVIPPSTRCCRPGCAVADAGDRPSGCRVWHDGVGPAGRGGWRRGDGGLLINTVPVRARVTAATTTSGLLDQLHGTHNHTLEHQHLALAEIHRSVATTSCLTPCSCSRTTPRHRRVSEREGG